MTAECCFYYELFLLIKGDNRFREKSNNMPKFKENRSEFCSRMVKQYEKVLRTDHTILYCKYCNCQISGSKVFNVKQHFETAKHKTCEKMREKKTTTNQTLLRDVTENKFNVFNMDICKMFLRANIPINKISHPAVVEFLEKYTQKTLPSQTVLRSKYVPVLYESVLENLRLKARDKKIWVSIDETTDVEQRLVANFIFGILDNSEEERKKSYLLNVAVVDAANANSMAAFLNDSLHLLWPEGILYENILLIVTDAAAYMIAAMKSMQTLYPKVVHLTCFAHGLHRLAEYIRSKYANVNALISQTKSVFLKAPSRRHLFKRRFPDMKLPPQPCITRWGTWLEAVHYYSIHFDDVRSFLNELKDEDSEAIYQAKKSFANPDIKLDLAFIEANFFFLCGSIVKLQTSGLCLKETVNIMLDIKTSLEKMSAKHYSQKFNSILQRNPGFVTIVKLANILFENSKISDKAIDKWTPDEIQSFKYCPVTSADVERSFSTYSNLLNEQRRSFSFENIKKNLIVQYNTI